MRRVLIAIAVIVAAVACIVILFPKGISITICNNSVHDVNEVLISCGDKDSKEYIINLRPGKKETVKYELPDDFDEGRLTICYKDKDGKKKTEVLEGYVEKGDRIKTTFTIND